MRSPKILLPEGHLFHLKSPAPEIIQDPGIRGQIKGKLIGIQGMNSLSVEAVNIAVSVLSVPQQRTTQICHGGPDLVGAAGKQLHLQQS